MPVQDDWYRRAELAVQKGDDELAKEALKRRKSNQENADVMKAQLDQQRKAVDQLVSNTRWVPVVGHGSPMLVQSAECSV